MPQQIAHGYKELVADAESEIDTLTVEEAMTWPNGNRVLFVDVRDVRELWREGRIPGALHVPRGMLEFWIDPDSPYHKPAFSEDAAFIFYCAAGLRSALATQTARRMGLQPVYSLKGGFAEWCKCGGPTEAVERK